MVEGYLWPLGVKATLKIKVVGFVACFLFCFLLFCFFSVVQKFGFAFRAVLCVARKPPGKPVSPGRVSPTHRTALM